MMTMIDDLVFDLPHPRGLHDLLEHRSLDRPKLPVRNCLQLNNVLFDIIIIIIIIVTIILNSRSPRIASKVLSCFQTSSRPSF